MKISVIVPTYKRPDLIERCLSSLAKQNFPKGDFEILVCGNSSDKQTAVVVNEFIQLNRGINIRYLHQSCDTPSKARNLGIGKASGTTIAFTDDDCQPDDSWLDEIYKSFESDDIYGAGGVTYTQKHDVTPLTSQIENNLDSSFPTCNVAYKKSVLDMAGGFDENFPATNEDVEIAWRIGAMGKIVHNPKIRVLHPPRRDSFSKQMKGVINLEGEYLLWEKLPGIYRKNHIHPLYFLVVNYMFRLGLKRLILSGKWLLKDPTVNIRLFAIILCQRLYLVCLLPYFIYRSFRRRHA